MVGIELEEMYYLKPYLHIIHIEKKEFYTLPPPAASTFICIDTYIHPGSTHE
jgi:hypothetical protein